MLFNLDQFVSYWWAQAQDAIEFNHPVYARPEKSDFTEDFGFLLYSCYRLTEKMVPYSEYAYVISSTETKETPYFVNIYTGKILDEHELDPVDPHHVLNTSEMVRFKSIDEFLYDDQFDEWFNNELNYQSMYSDRSFNLFDQYNKTTFDMLEFYLSDISDKLIIAANVPTLFGMLNRIQIDQLSTSEVKSRFNLKHNLNDFENSNFSVVEVGASVEVTAFGRVKNLSLLMHFTVEKSTNKVDLINAGLININDNSPEYFKNVSKAQIFMIAFNAVCSEALEAIEKRFLVEFVSAGVRDDIELKEDLGFSHQYYVDEKRLLNNRSHLPF